LEWFLPFFRTMDSSYAEDRRLTKDGGEVRIEMVRIQMVRIEMVRIEMVRIQILYAF
jgi:hypothetical protein